MKRFLRNNGLSLTLFGLFFLSLSFQSVAGMHKHNEEQEEHGQRQATYGEYVTSEDFLESVAENWESEFLEIFTFMVLTRFLYQKGSPQSRDPDAPEKKNEAPSDVPPEKRPWPVRRGGWVLKLYEHSLSLTFMLLFFVSVTLHAIGGAGDYNQEQLEHGRSGHVTAWQYLLTSSFWFQSLQNWQSEFLSIFCMVTFSIWLREKDSAESKPVEAPHDKTGEE